MSLQDDRRRRLVDRFQLANALDVLGRIGADDEALLGELLVPTCASALASISAGSWRSSPYPAGALGYRRELEQRPRGRCSGCSPTVRTGHDDVRVELRAEHRSSSATASATGSAGGRADSWSSRCRRRTRR
jgi:hypothetical protein